MPKILTEDHLFSPEAFFVAVVKSEAIKQMDQEEQENFRWFLFNAQEKVQRQFFDILKKEESINQKYNIDKAHFAQDLLREYKEEAAEEGKKFGGMIRRKTEDDQRNNDLNKSENLISNL